MFMHWRLAASRGGPRCGFWKTFLRTRLTLLPSWISGWGPYEKLFDDNVRAYPEPNKVINFTRYIIQCVLRLIGDYIMDAVDLQADDISLAPPFP